ncbi:hypothetical protein FJU30_18045 [Affinibrenneria salicis]|uniref:Thiolase N-terminal domain-containing protein n=1 Tax=Affinibrenneria salicis TaxID=2590031 RepID=A0A5J5FV86_9GAMM|nr:hypothetical protein [Affinibrenneria salicis]KAA8997664.1 hypothetical protein FJU30_18045 [Affinibrenneria salicis]
MTINKVCGSGLKAMHLAMQSIENGDAGQGYVILHRSDNRGTPTGVAPAVMA